MAYFVRIRMNRVSLLRNRDRKHHRIHQVLRLVQWFLHTVRGVLRSGQPVSLGIEPVKYSVHASASGAPA